MSRRAAHSILCALLGGISAVAVAAQDAPAVKGADLGLLEEVRAIAGKVEEFVGPFERKPIAVRVTDPMREVAATIRAQGVLRTDRLEARGRAWADLGFGGVDAPQTLLRILATDLAGIGFDPAGNRLLIDPSVLTAEDFGGGASAGDSSTVLLMTGVRPDEPLVGHYLVHVRQIERTGSDPLASTTDRLLAQAAWSEGEANLLAVQHLFSGMGLADEVLHAGFDPGSVLDGLLLPRGLAGMPETAGDLARFVYLDGFAKVVEAYLDGGWSAVARGSEHAARTRDLLHPDRRLASEERFSQPDPPPGTGWILADEDSLGEQGVVVLVSRLTGKDNLGLMAGDGWRGDRLFRFERAAGAAIDGVTEWRTRWDTAEAAADFEYALVRCLKSRFPGIEAQEASPGRFRVEGRGRTFRLERAGTRVALRIAAPAVDAGRPVLGPPPAD